ncbi:MAG: hypothetical protein QOJ99_3276, partial [Bryobacterales bacterium]|nr:hypothetical protein [Bryobacterales bacterium]
MLEKPGSRSSAGGLWIRGNHTQGKPRTISVAFRLNEAFWSRLLRKSSQVIENLPILFRTPVLR